MGQIVIFEQFFQDFRGGGILYSLKGNYDPKTISIAFMHLQNRCVFGMLSPNRRPKLLGNF